MHARHIQFQALRHAAFVTKRKHGTETFKRNIGDANISSGGHPICNEAPFDLRNQRLYRRLIDTKDCGSVKGNLVNKRQKCGLDVFQVTIVVEMVGFNVRYDCNRRRQQRDMLLVELVVHLLKPLESLPG